MGAAGEAPSCACALPCPSPRPKKTLRAQRSGTSTDDFRGKTSGCRTRTPQSALDHQPCLLGKIIEALRSVLRGVCYPVC